MNTQENPVILYYNGYSILCKDGKYIIQHYPLPAYYSWPAVKKKIDKLKYPHKK